MFPWEISSWELYSSSGDASVHYSSWLMFASDDFRLPLTFSEKIAYPNGVSVIYADPIPLLAILSKYIFKFVNTDFQYFGIHFWISSSLMFYFSTHLISKFFNFSSSQRLFLSILLMTSPIASMRISGHEALSAHWVIIACFYTYLVSEELNLLTLVCLLYSLLFLSLGIHAYLASFVLITICCITFHRLLIKDFKPVLLFIFTLVCLTPLFLNLWGYTFDAASVSGKLWSANLLALFDSQDHSRFFKSLPKEMPLQWEGFSYLGLGIIVMILILVIKLLFFRLKSQDSASKLRFKIGIFVISLLFLYSLGNPIYIGKFPLLDIGFEDTYDTYIPIIHEVFRATGRYIWPVYYSIILYSFFLFDKFFPKPISRFLVPLFVLINIYETNAYVAHAVHENLEARSNILEESFVIRIDDLVKEKNPEFLFSSPSFGCVANPLETYSVAAKYKLATNNFYLARYSDEYTQFNCIELPSFIQGNTIDSSKLNELVLNLDKSIFLVNEPSTRLESIFSNEEKIEEELYVYY